MFRGYKLKFEFNAAHSNVENHIENAHFHTFTIVLYLDDLNEEMDFFYDIERDINQWLTPFQDCYLHQTQVFAGRSTTLESIGETFYDLWKDKLKEKHLDLVRLDIFENPIRVYTVSDRILDADVNRLSALPHAFYDVMEYESPIAKQTAEEMHCEEAMQEELSQVQMTETAEVSQQPKSEKTDDAEPIMSGKEIAAPGKTALWLVGGVIVTFAVATLIMYVIYRWGNYPSGSDTYCHLYRADIILQNIREGNWFPLYDPYWYNGVEIMRYWGPVPLYVLAFTQYLGGDIFAGYIGYVGLLFVVGAIGWLWFGKKVSRMGLGLFIGGIWFLIPENMKVIFYDGNMPRALINALLPWMICFVYDFMDKKTAYRAAKLTLIFTFITLCHIGTTLMLVVVLLIYLLLYGKVHKNFKSIGQILLCVLTGMLISGIWMIPSFFGSGAGGSNNQVMEGFFQNALLSLNPFPAWNGETLFYFGLSLFVLCLLGFCLGTKETLPGFGVGLIIFLLTSESAYDILSKLPFSSYLWMMRFVSMALAFVMTAFLLWKGLRRHFVVFLCLLLVVDCVPVIRYIYSGGEAIMSPQQKNDLYGKTILMHQAKEITNQRMTVFDLSSYGAYAPYYAAGTGRKVLYMFGAGWEGARTADNIVMLNTAVESGAYTYVFDRCMEMGADTLVFVINNLQNKNKDVENLTECGKRLGYQVKMQTDENILFHKETPEEYGVISEYPYLAIGNAAHEIALLYPSFEEGKSDNLSEYEYEELARYTCIYLSDFTYDDKRQAEDLLQRLAQSGTRVYIDMNKIPVDRETNIQEIFDVSIQSITYHNNFPVITYEENQYKTSGFPEIYKEWKANYLIGLKNVTGKSDINGVELAFCGTNGNDNIVFLGYNFMYYTEITKDAAARKLVSKVLGISQEELPMRRIVPIHVEFGNKKIVIDSPESGVGTTLADITDIFVPMREYENRNHMITVDKGETVIYIQYPYFKQGLTVTLIGICMLVAMMIYFHKTKRRDVL